jgi:hypothetical protein
MPLGDLPVTYFSKVQAAAGWRILKRKSVSRRPGSRRSKEEGLATSPDTLPLPAALPCARHGQTIAVPPPAVKRYRRKMLY